MRKYLILSAVLSLVTSVAAAQQGQGAPGEAEELRAEVILSPANEYQAVVLLSLPEGYHLNEKAPSRVTVSTTPKNLVRQPIKDLRTVVRFPAPAISTNAEQKRFSVRVGVSTYYCPDTDKGICHIRSYSFVQPVLLTESAELRDSFEIPITLPAG